MKTTPTPRYRSNLERTFNAKMKLDYEVTALPYVVTHHYTPDFTLAPNKFVETKGLFVAQDRSKHRYIRYQHPQVRVLFVFQNPKRKLTKTSKTTYADWCDKNGFCWLSEGDALKYTPEQLLTYLNNFEAKAL